MKLIKIAINPPLKLEYYVILLNFEAIKAGSIVIVNDIISF